MKLVKKFDDVISVYWDNEWQVYKIVVKGRPEATSEEDEKQDAFDTAAAMVKHRAENPEAYEPQPLPDDVIRRVGEWDIGRVEGQPPTGQELLWWGHCSTDEELGCGQIRIENEEVFDYDNYAGYGIPSEVVKALALEGYDVSYLEDEDNA